jgi:hypothetical protein
VKRRVSSPHSPLDQLRAGPESSIPHRIVAIPHSKDRLQKTFIESAEFTEWVKAYLSDEDLAAMHRDLLAEPDKGDVMTGCGGLRKPRIADPKRGKGKRSGARVIYLHIEEANAIHLITVYGKDEKDDLSASDKRLYRRLVQILNSEAQLARRK